MTRPFDVGLPLELAFRRDGRFAIELLDPVTLERVFDGVRVSADGLRRSTPYINTSGMFVWLNEDVTRLQKIAIDPRALPYDTLELLPAQLNLSASSSRVTTIELPPRTDYPFSAGTTAARGTLLEDRSTPPVPVQDAGIHLRWLDDDGVTWRDASTVSRTNARGDFAAVLRLAPADTPRIDAHGALTIRVHARRANGRERTSADLQIAQGRVADPSTTSALTLAWDDMQP